MRVGRERESGAREMDERERLKKNESCGSIALQSFLLGKTVM